LLQGSLAFSPIDLRSRPWIVISHKVGFSLSEMAFVAGRPSLRREALAVGGVKTAPGATHFAPTPPIVTLVVSLPPVCLLDESPLEGSARLARNPLPQSSACKLSTSENVSIFFCKFPQEPNA